MSERDRRDRSRIEEGAPASAPPSATQVLQRTLGNQRVLQLRARLRNAVQAQRDGEEREGGEVPAQLAGGRSLDGAVQRRAEQTLGVGLGDVRVVQSAEACGAVDAHAFATHDDAGPAVVLSDGVDLAAPEGQFTLMHELAHVAQQKRGATGDLDGVGGDEQTRSSLEDEADRVAERALGMEIER